MDLREAMSQIAEIRQQMARTEVFRGYRSVPVAFSGVLAWAAAIAQSVWIPDPIAGPHVVPDALGRRGGDRDRRRRRLEMALRARHAVAWAREHTWLAVEQFLPCVVAGGLDDPGPRPIARAGRSGCSRGSGRSSSAWGSSPRGGSCPGRRSCVAFYYLVAGPRLPGPGPGRVRRSPPGRWASPSAAASSSRPLCSTGPWNGTMAIE